MVPDFTPITAFKEQFGVEFAVAYKWNKEQVCKHPIPLSRGSYLRTDTPIPQERC